jgi:hypothetical protein
MGPLVGHKAEAVVAGDVRANENIALTATHTLFGREHNRIVSLLPATLSAEERFQIARRIVGAEQQYITYTQFLPALGIHLARYRGYNPNVNPTLTNEFATVGYRVHSMVHGELEPTVPKGTYVPAKLEAFEHEGVEVERAGKNVTLVIPLELAFGNPGLVQAVGLGPLLKGLGNERQYKNDEQIDESMRSVLFQIPKPGTRTRRAAGRRRSSPAASRTSRTSAQSTSNAAATTAFRRTTRCESPTGWPRRARTRPLPESRRRASRAAPRSTAATRSTTRASSTSRSSSPRTGRRSRSTATRPATTPPSGSAAPPWPPG